ncbi:MAG: hypothetical protein ABEI86_00820 [Halobacteriaceae archaeon]
MASYSELISFIEKKSAPELLIVLREQGAIKHGEITDATEGSIKTVSDRISDAKERDYVTESDEVRPDDHGNVTRYELTPEGHRIASALLSVDYDKHLQQLKQIKKQIEEDIELVKEWEMKFQKEAKTDKTNFNYQTVAEIGFPGDHDYPNDIAFYIDNKSVDPEEDDKYILEGTDDDYDPFKA